MPQRPQGVPPGQPAPAAGGDGSVAVTTSQDSRSRAGAALRTAAVVLAVVICSGAVLFGARLLTGAGVAPRTGTPPGVLDARSVDPTAAASAASAGGAGARTVPGSNRLVAFGPLSLVDTRRSGVLAAGAGVPVQLPGLPPGSTAVLLSISTLNAARPGAVTIGPTGAEVQALRLAAAGAQASTSVVVPVTVGTPLQARTEAGGHLLVHVVGVFEPVEASAGGRVVPVPAARVLRLVPKTDGKDGVIQLAAVPALRGVGSVSAVLLQFGADVGPRGGFVRVGARGGAVAQEVFWSATKGTDRSRGGLLLVPVSSGAVTVHYQAGTVLGVDLVGYVTDDSAAREVGGLAVPVPPAATPAPGGLTAVAAGRTAMVGLVPPAGVAGVPADRVDAALVRVVAEDGDVAVGGAASGNPTLIAAKGVRRNTLALVDVAAGTVRVSSRAGAGVALTAQAVILTP